MQINNLVKGVLHSVIYTDEKLETQMSATKVDD